MATGKGKPRTISASAFIRNISKTDLQKVFANNIKRV
jgi:hypothetical protein